MTNYLIELSLIHLVLFGVYWLFLKRENQYGKIRFYILGASLLSLIIPFLKLPRLFAQDAPINLVALPVQEITATSTATQSGSAITLTDILLYAYLGITLVFFVRFIIQLLKIFQLEKSSQKEEFNGNWIRRVFKINGSFSFFNWIFLGKDVQISDEAGKAIYRHEQAHASLGHSYDLIFLELVKVVFWWLPTTWLAKKEIKKIHEYQADAHAVKSSSIDQYSSILISSTLKANGLSLASSFHDGLIFKRLNAMKQKAKNLSPWKLGTIGLVTATLFVVFACSEELEENIQKIGESSNAVTFDQLPADMQANVADIKDALTFIRASVEDRNTQNADYFNQIEELRDIDPNTIHSINVVREGEGGHIYIAIKKDGANFDYLAEKSKSDEEVFMIVEKMPEFPGGMDAYYKYIGQNIQYPKQARNLGIEGRVMVEFVVEKDGSITDEKVMKGIGGGCDGEALRVVREAPDFMPGEQRGKKVRTKMIVPIVFKLEESESGNKDLGIVIIEELDMNASKLGVDAKIENGVWKGYVYDENRNKLAGVSIVEEGTNNGTVSDLDGTFSLKLQDAANHVFLSFIGYETVKLKSE